jgi:cupin 2 domain-containing protein
MPARAYPSRGRLTARRYFGDNHRMANVLTDIPADLPAELFETLVRSDSVHIERIVSRGHRSPEEGWYDQDLNEWVLLLQGAARLVFEGGDSFEMAPGDWLEIRAHRKHRVDWTDPQADTIWLAVHYR